MRIDMNLHWIALACVRLIRSHRHIPYLELARAAPSRPPVGARGGRIPRPPA